MFLEFVEEQFFLFIALGVIVALLIYSYFGDKISGYKSVNTDETVRLYNKNAKVFDVRTSDEFKNGYIGNAENITTGNIVSRVEQLSLDKNADILLYCQSGSRSAAAARNLVKMGYTQVHNLSGGILAWQNVGLPINKPVSKKKQKKDKKGK
jgi:rhodanese-related sulfurtransferase